MRVDPRLIALLAVVSLTANAQTAPATSSAATTASTDEAAVTLSPFQVDATQDRGYTATNTLAGSRLNAKLADTPSAISIMTNEFLSDVGAVNINTAINLGLNTQVDTADDNGGYRIRGVTSSQLRSRDMFLVSGDQIQGASDLYNVDRITFSRGPNSILYGAADPAGVIDIETNQAKLFGNTGSASQRFDNYGSQRATFDWNQVIIPGRLAIRFDLMGQDADNYRTISPGDHSPYRDKNGYVTLTAVLLKYSHYTMTLQANLEDDKGIFTYQRVNQFTQQATAWQNAGMPAVGAYSSTTAGVYPTGTAKLSSSAYIVNIGTNNGGSIAIPTMNWQNAGVGASVSLLDPNLGTSSSITQPVLTNSIVPMYTNLYGVDSSREQTDVRYRTIDLTQQIGDNLFVDASVNDFLGTKWRPWSSSGYTNIMVDPNTYLPNGQANPNFGKYYIERVQRPQFYTFPDSNIRTGLAYLLDLNHINPWLGHYNFTGSYEYRKTGRYIDNFIEVNNTPLPGATQPTTVNYLANTSNYVYRRYYLSPAGGIDEAGDINAPINDNGVNASLQRVAAPTVTETKGDSFSESMQAYLLKDRLIVTGGVRQDSDDLYSNSTVSAQNSSGIFPLATSLLNGVPIQHVAQVTKTYGAVLHLIAGISLYANKSDDFSPAVVRHDILGNLIPDATGHGEDYGFKFQFFDDKLSINLGGYQNTKANDVSVGNGGNAVNDSYAASIETAIGVPTNAAEQPGGLLGSNYVYSDSYKSHGIELELTYNPTPNWRIRLVADKNVTGYTSFSPQLAQYYNLHIAEWSQPQFQALVAPGSALTVAQDIVQLQNQIALANAQIGTGLQIIPYQGNFVTSYDLPTGKFKGFFIGGSETYTAAPIIGYPNRPGSTVATLDTTKPFYGRRVYTTGLWVGYQRKLTDLVKWKIQLNISNVLDDEKIIPVTREPQDGAISAAQVREPRKFMVENSFSF